MTVKKINSIKDLIVTLDRAGAEEKIFDQLKKELHSLTELKIDVNVRTKNDKHETTDSTIAEFIIDRLLQASRSKFTKPDNFLQAMEILFTIHPKVVDHVNTDKNQHNPLPLLHCAVSKFNMNADEIDSIISLLELFYKHKANFNIVNHQQTIAHVAIIKNNGGLIRQLHQFGCGLNRKDSDYKTSLSYAIENKRYEVIPVIRELGGLERDPYSDLQNQILQANLIPAMDPKIKAMLQKNVDNAGVSAWDLVVQRGDEKQYEKEFPNPEKPKDLDCNLQDPHGNTAGHNALNDSDPINALANLCRKGLSLTIKNEKKESVIDILNRQEKLHLFLENHTVKTTIQSQFPSEAIYDFFEAASKQKAIYDQKRLAQLQQMNVPEISSHSIFSKQQQPHLSSQPENKAKLSELSAAASLILKLLLSCEDAEKFKRVKTRAPFPKNFEKLDINDCNAIIEHLKHTNPHLTEKDHRLACMNEALREKQLGVTPHTPHR